MAKNNFISSDFYCLCCGHKGIPIPRLRGRERAQGHRKALYCIYCKETVNHYECRNEMEAIEFKNKFTIGEFAEEAKQSMAYTKQEKGSVLY